MKQFDTNLSVVEEDTLLAASRLHNPVALNMANAFNPGGGWLQLCGAQEESLCFRSGLSKHLLLQYYPLKGAEVLYAADVPIWFGPESQGYPEIRQQCSFISCAATDHPALTRAGRLPKHEIELLVRKIHLVLYVAKDNGHNNIILSALGCGAFANPAQQVAHIFKDVLKSWDGVFDNITFAILGKDNFNIFKVVLEI